MKEVVYRRYARILKEQQKLPQLIVIDGGKGQLNAAVKSLQDLDLMGTITIIGIAKRLEEIFFPGDPIPLYINKKSESLKLIQHLRNEAHRFAITFHRDQRSSGFTRTELTKIEGIGPKTSQKLLQEFKSVRKVRQASYSELNKVVGHQLAQKLKRYFDEEE
jgi:excinuclease ABC subunit C